MSLSSLQEVYNAYLQCSSLSIDSRNLPENCLFVALKGSKSDGNLYVEQALKQGARFALADDYSLANLDGVLCVQDALTALQELARYHRDQLIIPVIGLTGSNGKTTSKELLYSVLSQKYSVFATQGNLNNHIGVPLSILSIKPDHEIAVIEMGANHQKEIAFLSRIAKPDWVYITNYGKAHMEGFGGVEGIIIGKSEIYDYAREFNKKALINKEDKIQIEKSNGIDCVTFSTQVDADFCLSPLQKETWVGITWNDVEAYSQLTGAYNFTNLATAVSFGKLFKLSDQQIVKGIESYIPGNNRSEIKRINNITLIKDAYNANPSSIEVALENLSKFEGEKWAVLGDMYELGSATQAEHKALIEKAKSLDIELITVGAYFAECGIYSENFKDVDQAIPYIKSLNFEGKTLLVKGSRAVRLEKIYPIFEI